MKKPVVATCLPLCCGLLLATFGGCGPATPETSEFCVERTLEPVALEDLDLATAIIGQWKNCPPAGDSLGGEHYCEFRRDGTYLHYLVDDEGRVSDPNVRRYEVQDTTLLLDPPGPLYLEVVGIEDDALVVDSTSEIYWFRAVSCAALGGEAEPG